MNNLSYDDADLLLTMGANGFGLNRIAGSTIILLRYEDNTIAIIDQTKKGLKIRKVGK